MNKQQITIFELLNKTEALLSVYYKTGLCSSSVINYYYLYRSFIESKQKAVIFCKEKKISKSMLYRAEKAMTATITADCFNRISHFFL